MTDIFETIPTDPRKLKHLPRCEDLHWDFPPIFKITETITFEHVLRLRDEGLEDAFRVNVGVFTHYTLKSDLDIYTGAVDAEVLKSLDDDAGKSLLVRWHSATEQAIAYLEGIADALGSSPHFILRTAHGAFTLIEIPTTDMWPGPMVFYTARYSHEDGLYGQKRLEFSAAPGQNFGESQLLQLVRPEGY